MSAPFNRLAQRQRAKRRALPYACDAQARHELRHRLDVALDPENLPKHFADVILIWNTAYLLVQRHPEYRKTALEAAVLDCKQPIDAVYARLKEKKPIDAGTQLKLGVRMAGLMEELGTVPYSRVYQAEDQALAWMERNKIRKS